MGIGGQPIPCLNRIQLIMGERAKFCVLGWEPVLEEDGELSERLFPFSLWHDG